MTGDLQIKNGKFYMVLNSTENGKRKQRWISTGLPVKGNKRKAEQMLRERLAKEGWNAPSAEAADIKLSDYIRRWLALSEQRVDEVTMQGYRALAERHVLPWAEQTGLTLAKTDRRTLQAFLDEKGRSGRLDGKGGFSPAVGNAGVVSGAASGTERKRAAFRESLRENGICFLLAGGPITSDYVSHRFEKLLKKIRLAACPLLRWEC